jgi:hypothetical protein
VTRESFREKNVTRESLARYSGAGVDVVRDEND